FISISSPSQSTEEVLPLNPTFKWPTDGQCESAIPCSAVNQDLFPQKPFLYTAYEPPEEPFPEPSESLYFLSTPTAPSSLSNTPSTPISMSDVYNSDDNTGNSFHRQAQEAAQFNTFGRLGGCT